MVWRIVVLVGLFLVAGIVPNLTKADDRHLLVTFSETRIDTLNLSGAPGRSYRRKDRYGASPRIREASERLARDFGLEIAAEWRISPLSVYCFVYLAPPDRAISDLIADIVQVSEVESAQPLNDFRVQTAPYNDPFVELQHGADTLSLHAAHRISQGNGTTVAVIDTGADLNHPELKRRGVSHRDFVEDDSQPFHKDRHGTAVAGIIGARINNEFGIVGVAPQASLTVLKACWYERRDEAARCNTFTLAKALAYAIDRRPDVINLSLVGPRDPLLTRLVETALADNISVIAAKGSGNAVFPSEIPGVISANVEMDADPTSFAAPAQDVLAPVPDGRFDLVSGSSIAAAHLAGVVALLRSANPSMGQDEIQGLLRNSEAEPQGMINACRALALIVGEGECAP